MRIQEAGGDLKKTKYWLQTMHPGYGERSFHVNHKTHSAVDGNVVMSSIARQMQSNKEIKIDDAFAVAMNVFKKEGRPLKGKGNKYRAFRIKNGVLERFFGVKQNRVIGETHCLPKAMGLASLKSDIDRCTDDPERNEKLQHLRSLIRAERTLAFREEKQLDMAMQILEEAGMDPYQEEHDRNDLLKLAEYFWDYQIVVWILEGNQTIPIVQERLNSEGKGFIGLFLHDGHYEYVERTKGSRPVNFCHKCSKFGTIANHATTCSAKCRGCGFTNCEDGQEEIHCDKCNKEFKTQKCYENHLVSVSLRALPHCEKYFKCPICFQIDRTERFRGEPHKCFATSYCRVCREMQGRNHSCKHPVPSEKQKNMKREKQKDWKVVVYDMECVVVNSGEYEGHVERGPRHEPNLICAQMFCNKCRGKQDCDDCKAPWYYSYKDEVEYGPYQTQEDPGFFYVEERKTPLARFAQFLLTSERTKGCYVIAHNGGSYDHPMLLGELDRQVKVRTKEHKFLLNGMRIISAEFEAPDRTLHFRDSLQFLQMPLAKMPEAFGIGDEAKGFFPHLYNHPDNYDKVLDTLPPKEYYSPEYMTEGRLKEFEKWYGEAYNNGFKIHDELLKYCRSDVRILTQTLVNFIQMCEDIFNDWNPLANATTLASYVMFVLRHEYIKDGDVGFIPENGFGGDRNSALALKYLQWYQKKHPKAKLQYLLKGGEKTIQSNGHIYYADGYDATTNTVIEIHGCFYHGCPKCYPNSEMRSPLDKGITMGALYERTMEREEDIKDAGFNLHTIWECEIHEKMLKNRRMAKFFRLCKYTRRLQPRDALFGGRTQVFRSILKRNKKIDLEYWDFTSMYPYLNAGGTEYPRGNPTVITQFFPSTDGPCPYRGLIYCDVLPDSNLDIGLLPQTMCGKLMFVLCRTCGLNQNTDEPCNHVMVSERYLTGVWCTDELNFAISKGYKVLRYHEIWYWPDTEWVRGGFFAKYIKPLLALKYQSSGWPSDKWTDEEKERYASTIEEKDGVELDRTKFKKNKALRSLTKIFLNSAWGKFAQNPIKAETKLIDIDDEEMLTNFFNDARFEPTAMIDYEDKIFISRTPKREALDPKSFTNLAIAAITTSAARLRLLEAIFRVGVKNMMYCDTYSLIFKKKRGEPNPLGDLIGDQLGYLTSEIPEGWLLVHAVAMAPKVYALKMKNPEGEYMYSVKAKGISLNSGNMTKINFYSMLESMKEFDSAGVVKALEGEMFSFKRGETALDGLWTYHLSKRISPRMDKGHYKSGKVTPFGQMPIDNNLLINDYPF
ncbi:unnamed protein product [Caenorhabditis brenneri]